MIARVACLFLIDEQHRRDYAIIRFRNRSGSVTRLDSINFQIKISDEKARPLFRSEINFCMVAGMLI